MKSADPRGKEKVAKLQNITILFLRGSTCWKLSKQRHAQSSVVRETKPWVTASPSTLAGPLPQGRSHGGGTLHLLGPWLSGNSSSFNKTKNKKAGQKDLSIQKRCRLAFVLNLIHFALEGPTPTAPSPHLGPYTSLQRQFVFLAQNKKP